MTPDVVRRGRALRESGETIEETARILGVGKSQLAAALSATAGMKAPPPVQAAPQEAREAIDADGDPLDVMRALLANTTKAISTLPLDSPRLGPARAEARAITKAIAGLERERAGKQTPEELERRRRREDGETRQRIERYVLEYEREAEARGVCVHCGRGVPT
jgi:hypothetical protein